MGFLEVSIFFTACLAERCYAEAALSAGDVRAFVTADQIEVRFVYHRPVVIPLSTAGLNAAVAHIKDLNAGGNPVR